MLHAITGGDMTQIMVWRGLDVRRFFLALWIKQDALKAQRKLAEAQNKKLKSKNQKHGRR